jgi:hypothetical protein
MRSFSFPSSTFIRKGNESFSVGTGIIFFVVDSDSDSDSDSNTGTDTDTE